MRASGLTVIDQRRMAAHALTPEALDRLQRAVVALVGLGNLGGAILPHLAMLGISVILVDGDSVAPENRASQAFSTSDVGDKKAFARERQARALDPGLAVEAIDARVESLGLARFGAASLIIAAVDSYSSRVRLNEMAVRTSRPLLDVALDGTGARELGTVSLFDPARGGPCRICATSRAEHAARLERERPRGCPSFRQQGQAVTAPSLATSAQGAVIAGFAVQLAIRVLLDEGAELFGTRLIVGGGARPRLESVTLARSARCLSDHAVATPLAHLAESRVGATLAAAARHLGGSVDGVHFPGRTLVAGLVCTCGGESAAIGVIGAAVLQAARCERCGSADLAPLAVTSTLAGDTLERARTARWDDLGVPSYELVELRSGEARGWFVIFAGTEV